MAERVVVATADAPGAIGPYSQGIQLGDLVFISGQLPIDMATGELCAGSIGEQTKHSLKNAAAIAKAAGTDLSKAVKTTIFLTSMADFAEVNAAYRVEIEVICGR